MANNGWTYQSAATTSGAAFDFAGIPAGVSEIEVHFNLVSLSGADNLLVQLGTSGGIETSGYSSGSGDRAYESTSTNGLIVFRNNASVVSVNGAMRICDALGTGFTWSASHACSVRSSPPAIATSGGGNKTLSAVLDRVRLTRTGSNTFNGGTVYVCYR